MKKTTLLLLLILSNYYCFGQETTQTVEELSSGEWWLKMLFGGGSLLGLTADVVGIYAFVMTVRRKQYKDIPTKLLIIVVVFLFSIGAYLLARDPKILTFDVAIYFFAIIYMALYSTPQKLDSYIR